MARTDRKQRPASPGIDLSGRKPASSGAVLMLTASALAALWAVALLTDAGRVGYAYTFFFVEFFGGVFTLVGLTMTVMIGLLATDRLILTPRQRVWIQSAHRTLGIFSVGWLFIHILTKVSEGRASLIGTIIPFLGTSRAGQSLLYVGLGPVAGYLMASVLWTGLVRRRFVGVGRPWMWRALHSVAYLSWPVALLHGLGAGRPPATWVTLSYLACVLAVAIALLLRLSMGSGRRVQRDRLATTTMSTSAVAMRPVGRVAQSTRRRPEVPMVTRPEPAYGDTQFAARALEPAEPATPAPAEPVAPAEAGERVEPARPPRRRELERVERRAPQRSEQLEPAARSRRAAPQARRVIDSTWRSPDAEDERPLPTPDVDGARSRRVAESRDDRSWPAGDGNDGRSARVLATPERSGHGRELPEERSWHGQDLPEERSWHGQDLPEERSARVPEAAGGPRAGRRRAVEDPSVPARHPEEYTETAPEPPRRRRRAADEYLVADPATRREEEYPSAALYGPPPSRRAGRAAADENRRDEPRRAERYADEEPSYPAEPVRAARYADEEPSYPAEPVRAARYADDDRPSRTERYADDDRPSRTGRRPEQDLSGRTERYTADERTGRYAGVGTVYRPERYADDDHPGRPETRRPERYADEDRPGRSETLRAERYADDDAYPAEPVRAESRRDEPRTERQSRYRATAPAPPYVPAPSPIDDLVPELDVPGDDTPTLVDLASRRAIRDAARERAAAREEATRARRSRRRPAADKDDADEAYWGYLRGEAQ